MSARVNVLKIMAVAAPHYPPLYDAIAAVAELLKNNKIGKQQWDRVAKLLGADGDDVDAVFAKAELIADIEEQWYVCGHPAWPDPLLAGNSQAEALATLRFCRRGKINTEAGWLLRTLSGGRVEYCGDDLARITGDSP